jgi:hypothetical protein
MQQLLGTRLLAKDNFRLARDTPATYENVFEDFSMSDSAMMRDATVRVDQRTNWIPPVTYSWTVCEKPVIECAVIRGDTHE